MIDPSLNHFKNLVTAHLDELEDKEAAEKKSIKKSILEAESMQKAGYPVGTIREWKGRKYIKIAPNKWRPKYDGNSRGAKMSIAALKRKADKCTSSEELLQLVLENRDRFSDQNGRPLPFVKELSDYVSGKNDKLESDRQKKQAKKDAAKKLTSNRSARLDGGKTKQNLDSKEPDYKKLQEELKNEIKTGKRDNTEELQEDVDEWKNLIASGGYTGAHLEHLKEIVKIGEKELKRRENKKQQTDDGKPESFNSKEDIEKFLNENEGVKLQESDSTPNTIRIIRGKTQIGNATLNENGDVDFVSSSNFFDDYKTSKELIKKYCKMSFGDDMNGEAPEKAIKDIRDKYEASKSVTGNKKTVTLPDGTKIKCHYKIVEADAPTASHDETTFAPSKGFPTTKDGKSVNDRDYQNDADAQESVIKIASNFNSLALQSPPIVTKDGIVISGNNRTMSSKLAAKKGTDKAYLEDLREMADEYGIEPEDLDGFKNPRLILETDNEHEGDYTTEEFAQFNRDTKKTMNNVEKAVKLTKTLNPEKIQSIAESLQGYDTMGELYADTKGCQEFVNKLISAGIIGDNEKAQYCRTDGTLNDTGKDFCETVLVGGVLNEDNIRKLDGAGGKRIRQKLVRAILPLIENKGTGKEYSFNTELNDAVNIAVTVAKDHNTYPTVGDYLAQGNLFGEKKPDAATSRLAEIIHDEGEKAFAQRMRDLNAGLRVSANGEQDIFLGDVESKETLLNRFLEIKKSIADILSKIARRGLSTSELVASCLNKMKGVTANEGRIQ